MTTRKPSKNLLVSVLAAVALLSPAAFAAQRAATYSEALDKAGDDGVLAYCYGPDWNKRSVRMLKSFWETPATEAAAGDAVLVAVPYYQDPEAEGADKAAEIRGGLREPHFGVCPTVFMMDKHGTIYATLTGMDDLGDEKGELGAENIKKKMAEFRRQQELLKQAESASGLEKARLLGAVADLSIARPKNLIDEIQLADPEDKTGQVRRNKHNAFYGFMYEQMQTKDGFLKKDFTPDVNVIGPACQTIIKDEAYRAEDRQAAYALLIGLSRVAGVPTNQLRGYITKCTKIDETTMYGKLGPALLEKWAGKGASSGPKKKKTAADRKAEREARRLAAKAERERRKAERKAKKEAEAEDEEEDDFED